MTDAGLPLEWDIEPARVDRSSLPWEDKSDQLEFEALDRVRAAAEKWAASLAAILGLFGTVLLVKGRSDFTVLRPAFEVSVGIALGLALATAAGAVYLAALAAQGTPETVQWPGGADLRKWEREQALKAKEHMRHSRMLTFVAVGFVVIATGLAWYGPVRATSAPHAITVTRGGALTCGQLKSTARGIVLSPYQGAPILLRGRPARTVAVVARCP